MNNKKKTFLLIGILVLTMLIVSGGTFAYFRWISSEDQQTNLAIQIEENINMHIENPLLTKAGMYPTNTCTNEAATMSGVSIIALENQTGVIARPKFKLRVKITDKNGNVITNNSAGTDNGNNPYRYFINYAVAEENGTCTEPLYSGNFNQNAPTYQGQTQWYDSEWITLTSENTGFPLISNGPDTGVSFNGTPYQTTYHNYKVWVWIDESYVSVNTGDVVSDLLQDAKIEVSWSENSTVQQIKAQAYAVFSSSEEGGDNSLRFYQSDEPITEDSTYAGRPVTNVYTGFETAEYTSLTVPWKDARELIRTVVVEDTISPISTAYWFNAFLYCPYFDVSKLDTSNVTDMSSMFNGAGVHASDSENKQIIGLENFETSRVVNMNTTFASVNDVDLSGIENWDVSNVTDMGYMFYYSNPQELDLSNWNVYKVTNNTPFTGEGASGMESDVITTPNWYTSYAVYSNQDNSLRFYRTTTDLTQEATWNELAITNVYTGFDKVVYSSMNNLPWYDLYDLDELGTYHIDTVVIEDIISPISTAYWFAYFETSYIDVTKLDTSNVTNMTDMFSYTTISNIVGLENWNTSNVTDMRWMFYEFGYQGTVNLGGWDVSNVTNMAGMFSYVWADVIGLENWNTSNVTDMHAMFQNAFNSNIIDLSKWNVSNVTDYDNFNTDAEDKVKAPSKFSS